MPVQVRQYARRVECLPKLIPETRKAKRPITEEEDAKDTGETVPETPSDDSEA